MKINIITLGCSKNTVDSENIAGHAQAAGHTVFFDRDKNDSDLVIVNTCGFINDAKEESINNLIAQIEAKKNFNRRHHSDIRHRRLVAVGCLVERYREELQKEMPEVDAWYGSHQWEQLVAQECQNGQTPFTHRRSVSTPQHYAYLKISEGCNRACSYCAIPLIRGKHKSRPLDELVDEAKQLVADGVKEIILIAQDTTYYGLDLYGERKLGTLMERLAVESGAHWIRLHYTYPTSFPTDAIDVMRKYDNICNYIDIPLQHINSRILSSMQRGIDRDGTLNLLRQFREKLPDVCIRTTLIVGYPGETEEDFEELKEFVRTARFDRMGCFAYSPEEGTAAGAMKDTVSDEEKQHRVSELMEIQESISESINESRVGRELTIIIDRKEGDFWVGRTEYDSPEVDDEVLVACSEALPYHPQPGDFFLTRITHATEHDLEASIIRKI
ncbi:MAG: 30S ribosomal protein S12 methylthiotransferase RimO [Bacteroidales bacterium]|nr:30S ribosomal protein S12 methylthiotransferase RimO [Bacteroidales bacterium]